MREYNELDTVWFMAGSLFKQYPYVPPTEAFPFEIFKQAFVAVQSCVVHLQKVSLARRFSLVPLGPPLLAYKSNCKAMLTAVEGVVQLVVDRPYKAGEPIVVWCGPQPNSKLLMNYGFVDEDNRCDRILIEDKRMVAQRNGKLSVQVFQVNAGKEKEAILDMLPYMRLGYVTDSSEMQSVISSQGPICPVPYGHFALSLPSEKSIRLSHLKVTAQQVLSSGSSTKRMMMLEDDQISFHSDSFMFHGIEDYSHQIVPLQSFWQWQCLGLLCPWW